MDAQKALDVSQELRMHAPHSGKLQALLNRAARLIEDQLPTTEKKACRGRFGGRRRPTPLIRQHQAPAAGKEAQTALF